MSNQSNMIGRAYEYICINTLKDEIQKIRNVEIEPNSNYDIARQCWEMIDYDLRNNLQESALAATKTLFDLEPLIIEKADDVVLLSLQKDSAGETGDVRDIIILRNNIEWQIGLSIKHNNFAVKHSRIGKSLDIGNKWYGIPCSNQYWNDIKPVFEYLDKEIEKKKKWSELPDKFNDVYRPLLTAFMNEIKRRYKERKDLPRALVEYLLGEYDFYKVISIDNEKITQIQSFNLRGKLNKPSKSSSPKIIIPITNLPTRIVNIDFKPESDNTIEMYMDEGWEFSFRIHNASTFVENSLKFDVKIIGMPTTIMTINCVWNIK